MALGSERETVSEHDGRSVTENSLASSWITVIDAGGMDAADASPVTNPTLDITASDHHIFSRQHHRGTFVRARMLYDDGVSGITGPVVKLFGRKDSNEKWQVLENMNGDIAVTLTVDTTNDASDGTLNFTHPDGSAHTWDCDGCTEFLFGVETAFAATGVVATAYLEAKVI